MKIKLCGVRTPKDAVLCAEAGADEVGVIFATTSRRRVTVEEAKAIRGALPDRLPLVGVFLDADLALVTEVLKHVRLSAVQLHGHWPKGPCEVPRYAAVQVASEAALDRLRGVPEAARILLDGPAGGSGIPFAWSLAKKARGMHKAQVFIAGGLTPENVAQAIREARPDGVDVASGIEGEGGFKDPAKVRAFVAAARTA